MSRDLPFRMLLVATLAIAAAAAIADSGAIDETAIDEFDRDHWAFRPIEDPPFPSVGRSNWPRTSIDHFVLARLESLSLSPAPRARRETLIRRLTFDLTGLPPTTEQLRSFLDDDSPGAYRRLVDRLLASPEYGRRWGQYWLDLARFAETDGFEHDKVRPTAWKYRDWVIDALNDDLPYDEFVSLQLAGDVLRPDDPSAAIATTFCLSGPDMPDINSQEERKHVLMNEVTSTISAALFSLQMGCAQCHDHKYDAISQADFYRLRAFFDPAVKLKRDHSVTTLRGDADPGATSHLMLRGDWRRPGAQVNAAFPRIVNRDNVSVASRSPGDRRAELARWLTDPGHTLTARTIVNRLWQHHFGRGLSSTPSDFGVMGQPPTHPALLDHLASRLVSGDWSLKKLHRQILLSAVYQVRSRAPSDQSLRKDWESALMADPENLWLSRFPRRRLDAESIRDAMFAASGSLNHQAGGPGISPPLPDEIVRTLKQGQWQTSPEVADHYRRSVYVFARRNLRYPMFATFDRPTADCSCAVRHESTTAVQSLLLLNSRVTHDAAQRLADKVLHRHADINDQCRSVYRRVLSRHPDAIELEQCAGFVRRQTDLLSREGNARPERAALADFCRAMFNSNAFLYVD